MQLIFCIQLQKLFLSGLFRDDRTLTANHRIVCHVCHLVHSSISSKWTTCNRQGADLWVCFMISICGIKRNSKLNAYSEQHSPFPFAVLKLLDSVTKHVFQWTAERQAILLVHVEGQRTRQQHLDNNKRRNYTECQRLLFTKQKNITEALPTTVLLQSEQN